MESKIYRDSWNVREKNVVFIWKIINDHKEDSNKQIYKLRKSIQDFDKTISKIKKTVNRW